MFNFRFHRSILSKYIMLLRNMARMSIARNSKAFIHSSRVCAEESQTLVKKAAEGKFNFFLSQVYTSVWFCKKRWKLMGS